MQHPESLRQLEDVAECLEVAVATAALLVADVGRTGHRPEVDHVAADVQVARRVAGVQHEALRRVRQLRRHQLAPEAHQLRLVIDQRPGAAIHRARRGAADLETGLLEDAEGGEQDALDLLGAQHLERRPAVLEARQRRERGPGGARRAAAVAAAGRSGGFGHGGAAQRGGAGAGSAGAAEPPSRGASPGCQRGPSRHGQCMPCGPKP